jgi:hypothetical protein
MRERLIWTLCLPLFAVVSAATAQTDVFANAHLGAATCATSQCHGKSVAQEGKNVQLNEYTTWIDGDRHSIAWQTLETDESKRIATKLGLKSAKTARVCLDCHTDNVPSALRGEKFQINDGVGCEACHGGSERWIESHTDSDATHAKNVSNGMLKTENAAVRAELCLSCHLGNQDKFTTHVIMGAGHPRLSFELGLFTANQPAHYSVDADYLERKGGIADFNLWLSGQLKAAELTVELAVTRLHDGVGVLPDFAFYDCHSCHHSMKRQRWTARRADGLQPGSLRLQLPNLVTVDAVARALGATELQAALQDSRIDILRAAQNTQQVFTKSATALIENLSAAQKQWQRAFTNDEIRAVRRALLDSAAADRASDYAEAEQIYYGFESLCYALDDIDQCSDTLDLLFESIADSDTYSPRNFSRLAKKMAARF